MIGLLAQIGVPSPDAFVRAYVTSLALTVTWLLLLACAVTILICGLKRIRSRRGQVMAVCAIATIAVVVRTLYVDSVDPAPPHHRVVLDLANSRAAPSGRWIRGTGDEHMQSTQGQVDVEMTLPGGQIFNDRVTMINLDRRGNRIFRVYLQKSSMSLEEAIAIAGKYIRNWNLESADFVRWCAAMRASGQPPRDLGSEIGAADLTADPSLIVGLRSYMGGEYWTLDIEVYWSADSKPRSPGPELKDRAARIKNEEPI